MQVSTETYVHIFNLALNIDKSVFSLLSNQSLSENVQRYKSFICIMRIKSHVNSHTASWFPGSKNSSCVLQCGHTFLSLSKEADQEEHCNRLDKGLWINVNQQQRHAAVNRHVILNILLLLCSVQVKNEWTHWCSSLYPAIAAHMSPVPLLMNPNKPETENASLPVWQRSLPMNRPTRLCVFRTSNVKAFIGLNHC